MESGHTSVLMREVAEALDIRPADVVVDATLGGAGHFRDLLARLGADGMLIGIDADGEAVERARAVYAEDRRSGKPVAHLVNDNFRNLARILERLGVGEVDKALFDLGWSGYQIAGGRGFSFQADEPLLMTYGEGAQSAAEIINSSSESELADIFFNYGEERFARQIAKSICTSRSKARILSTAELVAAIERGVPAWYRHQRTHFATKTFQALRIAANDELDALSTGLAAALVSLHPGGRLAVISFHSIEDRIVKNALRKAVEEDKGLLLTKKPVVPSRKEVLSNRRARSAKLRVFERGRVSAAALSSAGFHSYAS